MRTVLKDILPQVYRGFLQSFPVNTGITPSNNPRAGSSKLLSAHHFLELSHFIPMIQACRPIAYPALPYLSLS